MEVDSETLLDDIHKKCEKLRMVQQSRAEAAEAAGLCARGRALLVALVGMSVSACALAAGARAAPDDDDEMEERINCVGAARRVTKPIIRLALGSNRLSALVTAASSLLLLVAVMSKAWWRRGARWLAAPALLTASLELCADAADAALAAALLAGSEPIAAALHTVLATVLLAAEVVIWHLIAKFFEYDSPEYMEDEGVKQLLSTPFPAIAT